MTQYEKRAQNFLTSTDTQISARHERTGKYFPNDKGTRDVWKIRITRGTREYEFDFGSSIADRETWDKEKYPLIYRDGTIKLHPMPQPHSMFGGDIDKLQIRKRTLEKEYAPAGTGHRPTTYDILTCLTKYSPGDNVDDFAAEFGYEKPSEALEAFQAVQKEWDMMQKLFSDKEIETLQEIQ